MSLPLSRTSWSPLSSPDVAQCPNFIDINTSLLGSPAKEDLPDLKGCRVLVMGSGSGSNFEALTQALWPLGVEFTGLFCNRPKAKIIERAHRLGVPVTTPPPEAKGSPEKRDDAVVDFLTQPFDLLALAGYMRILPPRVVKPHMGKIVNIHPSILPLYPGLHAIKQAWDAKATEAGVTVHLVDLGVDTGAILGQAKTPVLPNDTLESLEERIHRIEHQLYPWVVAHRLAVTRGEKRA